MLFTAALRTLTTCTCVRGVVREGLDPYSDAFLKDIGEHFGAGRVDNGTDSDSDKTPDSDPDKTPVKGKKKLTYQPPKTPKAFKSSVTYKKGKGGRGRRQRGLPKATVQVTPVAAASTDNDKIDTEILKDLCTALAGVKNELTDFGVQLKAVKDLQADIERADERRATAETNKNLALAQANTKSNVVTSLRSQLSHKTALHDIEQEKVQKLYFNARQTQDEFRREAKNHISDFRKAIDKAAQDILNTGAALIKTLDGQLDKLTDDNFDYLSSQKRKAPEDLSQPPAAQKASP